MSGGVQIPVEAKFDASDIEATIAKFKTEMNKLAASIASANKIKFNPIDRATLDDIRKVQAQFDSLKKISGGLRDRLKATGQGGAGFFDIDWARMYDDSGVRARQMRKAFEYVAAGTGASFYSPAAPAPAAPGGVPPRPPAPPSQPASPGAGGGGIGRKIIGSGLNAMGPIGGVANNALSAGLTGGAVAGLAGLAGGLVALGIGKAIGAVREKIGAAEQEFVGYDTLKRVLGDVNVSFGVLKDSLRASSESLDLTYSEGQKLGLEFAKVSGMMSDQYKTLAEETRIGGGFGRSFGLDPRESNQFFAQMRQFQVTSNESDSRRLALMISEGIAKSGAFAKADEVLQAISSYTAQQTRLGLTAANASGYTGLLAGLVGSRTPGLDVAGSANLLMRVNSSIASGGAAGEAGQNFLYMALGRRLGLDPIQSRILQEQGAFGTGAGTFGRNSLYAKFASKYGLGTPGTAAGSNATNLQMIMSQLQSVYAGKPELMLSAMSNLFGVNTSQAMALATIDPKNLNGLSDRLSRNGIDLKSVNATGLSRIAQIEANGNLSESEKDRQIKEVAAKEQERTEGSETRRTIVGVQNEIQKLAGALVGPINSMRDGILYLAGAKDGKGPMAIAKAVREAEAGERKQSVIADYDARIKAARGDVSKARSEHDAVWNDFRNKMMKGGSGSVTPEERESVQRKLKELQDAQDEASARILALQKEKEQALGEEEKRLKDDLDNLKKTASTSPGAGGSSGGSGAAPSPGAGNTRGDGDTMKQLAETDRMLGLPPGTSAAQIMQESGFDPKAVSKKGAMGLAQVMPSTLRSLEKRFGRKLNPYDKNDAILIHRELMRENMAHFGNVDDALRAYNGGWDKSAWGNDETRNYVPSIKGRRDFYSMALPAGADKNPGGQAKVQIEGSFTLNSPNGSPAAAPAQINKQVGVPLSFGMQ